MKYKIVLKILFYLNRGFLKRDFFPTALGALKSAAKICMYKAGLAFFLPLGRSGAGWGRAFRGSRAGASPPSPGERCGGRGSGRAQRWRCRRGAPARARPGLPAHPACARYSGMCGMLAAAGVLCSAESKPSSPP